MDPVSDESDTTNNCSVAVAVTVGAAPAPDLVVDRPTVSENAPDAEESFTLSATVRNRGNGASAFFDPALLPVHRLGDHHGDTEVGRTRCPALTHRRAVKNRSP